MLIHDLKTLDECRQVAALERAIWAYDDAEDVVPPPVLIVSIKRGGILLGAFDESGAMKGFVYSMPGVKNGRLTQWSHMLGVARDAREMGIGVALKLAQRDRALAMGVDLIEWTFDPLQAHNAHLNFARLGVIVEEYGENVYGESSSVLHRGSPTDRFIAQWRLLEPHAREAAADVAAVVNPSGEATDWLRPGPANLSLTADRLLVEIPAGFTELQSQEPELALEWRLATRAIFQHYLSRGYRVVDFFLSRESGRGHYLLSRTVEP